MEVKMMTVTAENGKEYQMPVFRDSDDVQEQINAATKDLQEQLDAAQTAKEEALASVETAREESYTQGEAKARVECAAKHFLQVVSGDGSGEITFGPVSFDPDAVEVICFRGVHDAGVVSNVVHLFTCDMRAKNDVDTLSGFMVLSNSSGDTTNRKQNARPATMTSPATMLTKCTKDEDGYITVKGIVSLEYVDGRWVTYNGVFGAGCEYICVAVKGT